MRMFPPRANFIATSAMTFLGLTFTYLMNPAVYCLLSLVTFVAAFVVSAGVCMVIPMVGVYAYPVKRSSHSAPVPLGGGIAILLGMIAGLWIFLVGANEVRIHAIGIPELNKLIELTILSAAVCLMGWLDDCYSLSWRMRLLFQITMATFFITNNPISFMDSLYIPGIGLVETDGIRNVLGVMWLVGSTNGFNFIDGLNGLASGIALMVLFGLLVLLGAESYVYAPILFVLIGAIAGLYLHNFPKARLFMGDAGSQMLGFFISGLALLMPSSTGGEVPLLAVPLLLWPCIYDVLNTFSRRLMAGRKVYGSHRDYIFHLLNKMGYSHLEIAVAYYIAIAHQIVAGFILISVDYRLHLFVFLPSVFLFAIYAGVILTRAKKRGLTL